MQEQQHVSSIRHLITQIMAHYGVNLSIKASVKLGWSYYFNRKNLEPINIVQVNDI